MSGGFEPPPMKTTALTLRLRPLGQDILCWCFKNKGQFHVVHTLSCKTHSTPRRPPLWISHPPSVCFRVQRDRMRTVCLWHDHYLSSFQTTKQSVRISSTKRTRCHLKGKGHHPPRRSRQPIYLRWQHNNHKVSCNMYLFLNIIPRNFWCWLHWWSRHQSQGSIGDSWKAFAAFQCWFHSIRTRPTHPNTIEQLNDIVASARGTLLETIWVLIIKFIIILSEPMPTANDSRLVHTPGAYTNTGAIPDLVEYRWMCYIGP
jgi:hypothetical protein